jgi:hypothetical protein
VSDWLAAGGTREQLLALAEAALRAGDSDLPAASSVSSVSSALGGVPSWPAPLGEDAFHGIAGEIVRAIEPHTEADPAALLLTLLAAVGNLIGREPHAQVEATRHGLNLFVAIVGPSAKARKGTSEDHIRAVLRPLDPEWEAYRVLSGSSTGEGLIKAVRDPEEGQEPDPKTGALRTVLRDPGVSDKRLLLIESELANTLKVMARKENTLSPVLRLAWDGKTLNTLTRGETQRATDAHISLVGHIVRDELRRHLNQTETANGFGNRFLWVCARRSKSLPFGGGVPELAGLVERLRERVKAARGMGWVGWSGAAAQMWIAVYDVLSEARPGLAGAVTGRAEAQVLRLATLYAVLDGKDRIDHEHLMAALAVWEYCEASAKYIFTHGERLEQRLMELLQQAPRGLTRDEIREHLGHHLPADRIVAALTSFAEAGLICREQRTHTGGRPAELWRLTNPTGEAAEPRFPSPPAEETEETEEAAQREPASPLPAEREEEAELVEETAHAVRETVSLPELEGMPSPPRARWGGA